MRWNWSWTDVVIFAIVAATVTTLVILKLLPASAYITLLLGILVKQPVQGFGQAVKDSLRPPPLPPAAEEDATPTKTEPKGEVK